MADTADKIPTNEQVARALGVSTQNVDVGDKIPTLSQLKRVAGEGLNEYTVVDTANPTQFARSAKAGTRMTFMSGYNYSTCNVYDSDDFTVPVLKTYFQGMYQYLFIMPSSNVTTTFISVGGGGA